MNNDYYHFLKQYTLIILINILSISLHSNAFATMPIKEDQSAAVILTYHKIDEPLYPSSHLSFSHFEMQIEELDTGNYNILPIRKILDALTTSNTLPQKTVAITFDGPYRSSYERAFPYLIERKIPFTIFVSPQLMSSSRSNTVSWHELVSMASKHDFIEIGLHPLRYERISHLSKNEIKENLQQSITEIKTHFKNFKVEQTSFSYPFGAYNIPYRDIVEELGLMAAFTHSSGVAYARQDLFQLPRYAMTEGYGTIERFRRIVMSLPLPLSEWQPKAFTSYLDEDSMIDEISFQVSETIPSLDLLRCFISGQDRPKMSVDQTQNLVTLTLSAPISSGRTRVNCTMPGPTSKDVLGLSPYRWHGMLYSLQ